MKCRWHQTKCLDRPTIGITGLMVGIEHNRGVTAHAAVATIWCHHLRYLSPYCFSRRCCCEGHRQRGRQGSPPISSRYARQVRQMLVSESACPLRPWGVFGLFGLNVFLFRPRDLSKCNGDFEACRKCEDISQKWFVALSS